MATETVSIDSSNALADDFINFFNISKPIENDTQKPHPKFATYCRKFSSVDNGVKRLQEKRRQEMLENLKRKREKIFDRLRPIIAFIGGDEDDKEIVEEGSTSNVAPANDIAMAEGAMKKKDGADDAMQVDNEISSKGKRNRYNRNCNWRLRNEKELRKEISKQLMLSEWLCEVPTDFYTHWYMVLCPRGKRTLVIAANGQTRIYSRTGYFMFQFQSPLPGGAYHASSKNSILDCIYVEEEHTFYVLDLISWNGCTFLDCETEFRFFWLQCHFAEEFANKNPPLLKGNSTANSHPLDVEMTEGIFIHSNFSKNINSLRHSNASPPSKYSQLYSFLPLSHYECKSKEDVIKLSKGPYQFNTSIDGVLFFHKQAPYTPGITPLVCWLKVDMIPEYLEKKDIAD